MHNINKVKQACEMANSKEEMGLISVLSFSKHRPCSKERKGKERKILICKSSSAQQGARVCHRDRWGSLRRGWLGLASCNKPIKWAVIYWDSKPLQANHIHTSVVHGGIMLHLLCLSRNQQLNFSLLPHSIQPPQGSSSGSLAAEPENYSNHFHD